MGVSSKGRREISHRNRLYYWYVEPDYDDEGIIKVHIISEDKKFIVSYEVGQYSVKNQSPYIVIIGQEFEGLPKNYTGYRRVLTPNWIDAIITPKLVSEIIDWCLLKEKDIKVVNWKGEIIE
ncbi:hypothetical protein [Paenibacillus daejeonensis]|uniref:hypothetical protein n=1 Tax=Paenibacillus daejeonensis TaxID=135193 RepID=UPI00037B25B3|nr:hypothetical protein [Paenibacillus daejeonensis]